jgi:hypothetical protein
VIFATGYDVPSSITSGRFISSSVLATILLLAFGGKPNSV